MFAITSPTKKIKISPWVKDMQRCYPAVCKFKNKKSNSQNLCFKVANTVKRKESRPKKVACGVWGTTDLPCVLIVMLPNSVQELHF
jgi:hypothetical protein